MFSWSNNRNSSTGHSRPEHISSYLNDPTLRPSTRKTSKDDSTYDTIFQTKDSNTLLIRVHIPPQNSNSRYCPVPIMTLVGIEATHPWLNDRMTVVGYGPTSSETEFLKSRLLLSQVVNAVVQHFQLNPPTNLRIIDKSLQKMQSAGRGSSSSGSRTQQNNGHSQHSSPSASGQMNVPQPPRKRDVAEIHFSEVVAMNATDKQQVKAMLQNYSIPSPPNTIPEVASISKNEMMDYLSDTNQLLPRLEENIMVTRMEEIKNSILSANHVVATTNLSKKDQLHNLHEDVQNLQNSLKEKVDKFNKLKAYQLELCKPISNELVLKKLKKAKKNSLNESDDLAYAWLERITSDNESHSVDAFTDEFLEKRIVHHVRAAKIERIQNS